MKTVGGFCALLALSLYWTCGLAFQTQTAIYDGIPNTCGQGPLTTGPFVAVGGGYYLVESRKKLNWFDAAHYCRQKGAQLATMETAEELEALSTYLVSQQHTSDQWFWLSGNDLAKEGQFHWLGTGQPIYFAKWSHPQPDNAGGNENCVHLWLQGAEFFMNDWQCKGEAHFICEAQTPKTFSISIW